MITIQFNLEFTFALPYIIIQSYGLVYTAYRHAAFYLKTGIPKLRRSMK